MATGTIRVSSIVKSENRSGLVGRLKLAGRISVADVLFAVFIFVLLQAGSTRFFNDPGTGWHLTTGDIIIADRAVPTVDPYSFTRGGEPWVQTQWLADVLMAGAFKLAGYPLISLLVACLLALLFRWIYSVMVAEGVSAALALPVTLIAAYAACGHFLARPLIATLIGVPLCFWWASQYCRGSIRFNRLLLLVPVTALWCNLHPGVLGGIATVGLCSVGMFLGWIITGDRQVKKDAFRRGSVLLVTSGAMGLATLCNPYGLGWHRWISSLMSLDMSQYVTEWMPPDLAGGDTRAAIFLGIIVVAGAILRRNRVTLPECLVILFWLSQAYGSYRHLPLLVAILALQSARVLSGGIGITPAISRKANPGNLLWLDTKRSNERGEGGLFTVSLSALLFVLLLAGVQVPRLGLGVGAPSPERYSAGAVACLRENTPSGPLFNSVRYGGTIIRELPGIPVFIDDRFGLYGEEFIAEYVSAVKKPEKGARKVLDKWNICTVLISSDSELANWFKKQSDWCESYRDELATIWVRDNLKQYVN